jgi:hypothetical protein
MNQDLLAYLLSLDDTGADDSLREHLAIRDEMAHRAADEAKASHEWCSDMPPPSPMTLRAPRRLQ